MNALRFRSGMLGPMLWLVGGYACIAVIAAVQSIAVDAMHGRSIAPGPVVLDQFLAIAPWIPASVLIALQTRRVLSSHPPLRAAGLLGLFGLAVVGVINLVQAGLLTSFGTWRHVPWLDQFAAGLASVGHFGFLWYVLVVLASLLVWKRYQPAPPELAFANTVEVADGPSRVIVPVSEIEWIEARGDYVRVHGSDRSFLKLERMKVLEHALDPDVFARVHRSAIVNLDRVREFLPRKRGDYDLVLDSGARVRLTRSRRGAVLARLRGASA